MASTSPTIAQPNVSTAIPKLRAIEPPVFTGAINTVDDWLFSLELYFEAIELDFNGIDSRKACVLACALFRESALLWYKR